MKSLILWSKSDQGIILKNHQQPFVSHSEHHQGAALSCQEYGHSGFWIWLTILHSDFPQSWVGELGWQKQSTTTMQMRLPFLVIYSFLFRQMQDARLKSRVFLRSMSWSDWKLHTDTAFPLTFCPLQKNLTSVSSLSKTGSSGLLDFGQHYQLSSAKSIFALEGNWSRFLPLIVQCVGACYKPNYNTTLACLNTGLTPYLCRKTFIILIPSATGQDVQSVKRNHRSGFCCKPSVCILYALEEKASVVSRTFLCLWHFCRCQRERTLYLPPCLVWNTLIQRIPTADDADH